jgi:hypothetical protein
MTLFLSLVIVLITLVGWSQQIDADEIFSLNETDHVVKRNFNDVEKLKEIIYYPEGWYTYMYMAHPNGDCTNTNGNYTLFFLM